MLRGGFLERERKNLGLAFRPSLMFVPVIGKRTRFPEAAILPERERRATQSQIRSCMFGPDTGQGEHVDDIGALEAFSIVRAKPDARGTRRNSLDAVSRRSCGVCVDQRQLHAL